MVRLLSYSHEITRGVDLDPSLKRPAIEEQVAGHKMRIVLLAVIGIATVAIAAIGLYIATSLSSSSFFIFEGLCLLVTAACIMNIVDTHSEKKLWEGDLTKGDAEARIAKIQSSCEKHDPDCLRRIALAYQARFIARQSAEQYISNYLLKFPKPTLDRTPLVQDCTELKEGNKTIFPLPPCPNQTSRQEFFTKLTELAELAERAELDQIERVY